MMTEMGHIDIIRFDFLPGQDEPPYWTPRRVTTTGDTGDVIAPVTFGLSFG